MTIQIYRFGGGTKSTDGDASMKDVLGGKGANLAEMAAIGLPVPPGFTIPCAASVAYKAATEFGQDMAFGQNIKNVVSDGLVHIRKASKTSYTPLLSVRSGARVSMPGMMDTILNVGLTSKTLPDWEKRIGERTALDSYRRLIQMYSTVALGLKKDPFVEELEAMKKDVGAASDADLEPDQLRRLISRYLKIVKEQTGADFPDTLEDQLLGAVYAVFQSWDNDRAKEYRKINNIPEEWGTAANVQVMVFGNMNEQSATGVLFSRDPSTGANKVTGEFLVNAQGEDVVDGSTTPRPLDKMFDWNPGVHAELMTITATLEKHYRDMQDIEFTVEDGKLYILQTRTGKRSAQAAFQVAFDLHQEGRITQKEACARVTAQQLYAVMQDRIDPAFKTAPTFKGIAAGGGIVSGIAMLTSANAVNCTAPCILVTKETDPDDIAGMFAARGILTSTGGLTSHAAVVGRGMNKTCVVGTTDMTPGVDIKQGQKVTIDGSTGNVWVGVDVPLIAGGASDAAKAIMAWMQPSEYAARVELSHTMLSTKDFIQAITAALVDNEAPMQFDLAKLCGADYWAGDVLGGGLGGKLTNLSAALQDFKEYKGTIYLNIDLTPNAVDMAYESLFGLTDKDRAKVTSTINNMVANLFKQLQHRIVIKGADAAAVQYLRERGYKVSGTMSTFADLLSDMPVTATPESIARVFGTKEAYDVAVDLLKKAGKLNTQPMPVARYWYDALNQE